MTGRRARWSVIMIVGACAAVSSCASPPRARYVGLEPDNCPYVSADQVANLTGHDIAGVDLRQELYPMTGIGCDYVFRGSGRYNQVTGFVSFRYLPKIGGHAISEQAFWHWAG